MWPRVWHLTAVVLGGVGAGMLIAGSVPVLWPAWVGWIFSVYLLVYGSYCLLSDEKEV